MRGSKPLTANPRNETVHEAIEDWKSICIRKEKEILALKEERQKLRHEVSETRLGYCKILQEFMKAKSNLMVTTNSLNLLKKERFNGIESQSQTGISAEPTFDDQDSAVLLDQDQNLTVPDLTNILEEKLNLEKELSVRDKYIDELQNELQN